MGCNALCLLHPTVLFLGAAIMQPLFGWVLDLSWRSESVGGVNVYSAAGYHSAMLLMAGFAVVVLVASLRLREAGALNVVTSRPDEVP